jgi:hypothetical protein
MGNKIRRRITLVNIVFRYSWLIQFLKRLIKRGHIKGFCAIKNFLSQNTFQNLIIIIDYIFG